MKGAFLELKMLKRGREVKHARWLRVWGKIMKIKKKKKKIF